MSHLIDTPDLTALAAVITVLAPLLALALGGVLSLRLRDEPPDKVSGFGV
jgi:hypothetical protein